MRGRQKWDPPVWGALCFQRELANRVPAYERHPWLDRDRANAEV
jgi:hypothetical protein